MARRPSSGKAALPDKVCDYISWGRFCWPNEKPRLSSLFCPREGSRAGTHDLQKAHKALHVGRASPLALRSHSEPRKLVTHLTKCATRFRGGDLAGRTRNLAFQCLFCPREGSRAGTHDLQKAHKALHVGRASPLALRSHSSPRKLVAHLTKAGAKCGDKKSCGSDATRSFPFHSSSWNQMIRSVRF